MGRPWLHQDPRTRPDARVTLPDPNGNRAQRRAAGRRRVKPLPDGTSGPECTVACYGGHHPDCPHAEGDDA